MARPKQSAHDRWFDRFKRVYLVFFVTYLVSLLLPLTGIMLLYRQVASIAEKNCAKNALTALSTTGTELRAQLNWMDAAASRFFLDSQMTAMIYADPLEYGDKRVNTFNTFSDHLNDMIGQYDQNFIGYRMLFQDSELVFYDGVISHGLEFAFEHTLHYDGLSFDEWYDAVFSGNKPSLLPLNNIRLEQTRIRALTYNYPIMRRSSSGNRKAVLQFFIREADLYPASFDPQSTGYLIDTDGTVLASIGVQRPFPLTTTELAESGDLQRLRDGLLVTTEVKDRIHLAMLIPDAVAFQEAYSMIRPMIFTFLLFAVIEGFLILYLAKRNARPIENLASNMTNVLETPRRGNELSYIHKGIQQLQQNQQTALLRNRQIETAMLLNRLLNERTDDAGAFFQAGEKLGINLQAAGYCVAVAQLPKGALPPPDALVPEPPDRMRVVLGEGSRNRLNLLYMTDTEANAERQESMLAHLQQIREQLPSDTRIGLGRFCAFLEDVAFSYNQAIYCLQQEQENQPILCFDEIGPSVNSLYFPLDQQQRIMNAVKHNNAGIIDQEFDALLRENTEKRHLTSLMKQTLLSAVEALLMMAVEDAIRQENMPDYLRSLRRSDDFRTETEILRKEFKRIAEQAGGRFAQVSNQRCAMESYLDEHYSDSMLSIGSMAEEFGFSESYFSVLFKETLGEPYSVYLEKLRLDKAAEMLNRSDSSIEDIAQKVGYGNSTTFRRAFKRVKGLSPQQYRHQSAP